MGGTAGPETSARKTSGRTLVIVESPAKAKKIGEYLGDAAEGAEIKVRVLKANGTVELRPITVGIKSEILAEVTKGLKEKELVVIGQNTAQGSATKSALSARKGP